MWMLLQSAFAGTTPDVGATWSLAVDGQEVGTREIRVRYEGTSGERVRILEAYTEFHSGERRKTRTDYRQRLTANAREGSPASFHSVIDADGDPREVQARFSDGRWSVTVAEMSGVRSYDLRPARVDLSTVDLFDPESDRKIAGLANARILSAEVGKILEGPVIALGSSDVVVGDELLAVEGYEWQTELGPWRFWYAANGFLVRYEVPLMDHVVRAELIGSAPRAIDEFPVSPVPTVESEDL
jgi:hypothetical protein